MRNKDWLKKSPVIRLNRIARRVNGKEYAKLLAYRMAKEGTLKRVARGAYTASDDIFSIASNLYYPSYISFLSASYRYGFTETIPRIIYVAAAKRHKPIDFEGYAIEFVPLKSLWGYHKEEDDVFLADVEKLMIDAFLRPEAMGNFEEIERVFENSAKIDVGKLCRYLKRLGSNKIFRQVGYMAEKYGKGDISSLMKIDRNYHNLNPFKKKGGRINEKWRMRI